MHPDRAPADPRPSPRDSAHGLAVSALSRPVAGHPRSQAPCDVLTGTPHTHSGAATAFAPGLVTNLAAGFAAARMLAGAVLLLLLAAAAESRAAAAPDPAQDSAPPPGRVSIAAAANLVYALDALDKGFVALHPGVALTAATGSSGSLVAQIRNGAPFDLFLSADVDYPRKLAASGAAAPNTLRVFAIGRLVLWTTRSEPPFESVESLLLSPLVKTVAIANPDTAPYGRAARETLGYLGIAAAVEPKLVIGENITQAAQFVESGNADAGFVALSAVLSRALSGRGHWLEVPEASHAPLEQGAILTLRGASNPMAAAYLEYLLGAQARKILEGFGYRAPHWVTPRRTP